MRISGIVEESITDGHGVRLAVFFQGCPHKCVGCHNPETWGYAGGTEIGPQEVIEKILTNPIIKGVTFSGGEPFSERNYAPMLEIIDAIKKENRDVWSYTGYTLEQLKEKKDPKVEELIGKIDILVDGAFEETKKNLELKFKGSSNQRLLNLKQYRETGILEEL